MMKHDLSLAKEVQRVQPFSRSCRENDAWKEIADAINTAHGTNVNCLGASRRFTLILESHEKDEIKNRYKYVYVHTYVNSWK